jgi:hypothetical protein
MCNDIPSLYLGFRQKRVTTNILVETIVVTFFSNDHISHPELHPHQTLNQLSERFYLKCARATESFNAPSFLRLSMLMQAFV